MISIEDFKKAELKIAKILSAERVEGSEKLIKLKVSLGEEERQIGELPYRYPLIAAERIRLWPRDVAATHIVPVYPPGFYDWPYWPHGPLWPYGPYRTWPLR